ncbi:MAG: hypothetical protein K0S29_41 [Gammaproteobacteria bacterium]|jgi:O-antigen ligase|nr:hypothetical protein [Gammaproteobacteria bacterium]
MFKQNSQFTVALFGLFLLGTFVLVNALTLLWLLPSYCFYDIRRITQLSLFLIISLMLFSSSSLREKCISLIMQLPKLSQIALLGFFVLGLISACFAALPRFGLLEWATAFMLFVMTISLAAIRAKLHQSFDRIMLYALMTIIGCYSFLALSTLLIAATGTLAAASSSALFYALAAPTFNNPRFLTQLMSWTLPLMVLPNLLYPSKQRWLRYILFLLAAYWWCLAFAGQSRALELASLVVGVLIFALFGKSAQAYLLRQIGALMFGTLLYFVLYHGLVHLPLRHLSLLDPDNRLQIWGVAITLIKAHPLLGVGPMHFSYYAYAYEQLVAHPHNAILMIACEWGIPAALMIISVIAWGLWRWLHFCRQQVKSTAHANLLIGISGSLLMAGIDSMFSGTLVMPTSQVMLSIIIAWALSLYFYNRPSVVSFKYAHIVLLALVLAAITLLIIGVAPDINRLPQIEANYRATCAAVSCVTSPNYWMQGWIGLY